MTDYATLEKIDDVSVLSLDDGKVNVFSIEMLEFWSLRIAYVDIDVCSSVDEY